MIVDLDQLDLHDRAGASHSFAEVLESGADVPFPLEVQGGVTFTRAGGVTWVRGEVSTGVTLTCARCARPFAHRLVGAFREGYRPAGGGEDEETPHRGPVPAVLPLPGARLDLTEVVRQHLVMALPIAPLCRPDCRGLCPNCGADRNEERCGCEVDAVSAEEESTWEFKSADIHEPGQPAGAASGRRRR